MKNLTKIAVLFIAAITFSCVEDDDFAVPDTAPVPFVLPEDASLLDIPSILNEISNGAVIFGNDPGDPSLFVEGYVISSDQAGNFFEEIIIQDTPENPTGGIRILIDDSPLSGFYQVGQRVYVRLNGLTAGTSNGTPIIGLLGQGNELEKIPAPLRNTYVFRDALVEDIVPTPVATPSDFGTLPLLTQVELIDVQFREVDLNPARTFANEPTDQFDGLRFLQSCSDFFAAPFRLETSTFADFRGNRLFEGSGSVTGVLTRDFEDDNFVINVNSLADFNFDPNTRCSFNVVACGTVGSNSGPNVIIDEDFENVFSNPAEPAGWTNFQENGTETWETFTGTAALGRSARVGSFRSGDAQTTAWLITPQIDFDAQTGEVFSFDNSNSFADGSTLQLLISFDWDGTEANIPTATWEPLADLMIVDDSENFRNWVSSGNASLDCVDGTGYIAFKYEGSGDSNNDGTYEIDNILLTSD